MSKKESMKTVLDSVHGTIEIPKVYFDNIIDTVYFQRLRRIEQNSCRSVFPSARHDRFIHSLGVYHLGRRIADHIWKKCCEDKNILPENAREVLETYKLACLLHDVGHTPFSHTFEEYFDIDKALDALKDIFKDNQFCNDIDNAKKAAEHEVISAIVAVTYFRDELPVDIQIDWLLLARMITGYRFLNNKKEAVKSFENAMIELIHGDIIDADGLDYVCRDVWAGGYKNFNIDLNRLINSIFIYKDKEGNFSVLYKSKALNEIETVLNVKNFQYLYVIKHHKVLLEQHILVEAMKSAAAYHLEIPAKSDNERENSLRALCDIDVYHKPSILKSGYRLFLPMDDDFVALMKLTNPSDEYINQWFARSFTHVPLWKSKLEFFNVFRPIFDTVSNSKLNEIVMMIISPECKAYLCNELGITNKDIITIEVKPKRRSLDASKINVLLNDEVYPYSELNHDMFSIIGSDQTFCYYYVNIPRVENKKEEKMQKQYIISILKNFISRKLREIWG